MKVLLHVRRTRMHIAQLSSRYLFIKSAPLILDKDFRYIIKTQQKSLYLKSYLLPGIDSSAFCCSFASPTTERKCTVQSQPHSTVYRGFRGATDQYFEILLVSLSR
jgi:hypothetical protein